MSDERRQSNTEQEINPSAAVRDELQKAWTAQQKKSFTLWVNGHLRKVGMKIEDIEKDFHDGKALKGLLEVISGETIAKLEKGKMRVHLVNNVQKCLDFIKTVGVRLHGIGAEEIVDGNLKMILGMIWTIILRFAIQDISVEELTAKEGLLLWCQKKTQPYNNVNVQNFHMSFKDGLAFCALIHRHRPDLIPNYASLKRENQRENLQLAFDVAETHLDIPQMLDADDIASCIKPDERAVMTYVSAYYHAFSSHQQFELAAKRLAEIFEVSQEIDDAVEEIRGLTNNLLEWIKMTIERMNAHNPQLTSSDTHACLGDFRSYQEKEKPPKAQERGQIEAKQTTLTTKLRIHNRPPYFPLPGQSLQEIDAEWQKLEEAEEGHEAFLLSEIKRLERCEQLASVLEKKAKLHHDRTAHSTEVVNQIQTQGASLAALIAMRKCHEAFVSEVEAHQNRVSILDNIVSELASLRYSKHDKAMEVVSQVKAAYEQLQVRCQEKSAEINEEEKRQQHIDSVCLEFAKRAGPLKTSITNCQEDLLEQTIVRSLAQAEELLRNHAQLKNTFASDEAELASITKVNQQLQEMRGGAPNPYTTITIDELNHEWAGLQSLHAEVEGRLQAEHEQQVKNNESCLAFAQQAGSVEQWISEQREKFNSGVHSQTGSLEDQLAQLNAIQEESSANTELFDAAEAAHNACVEARILENPHTKLTMQILRVHYQQLQGMIASSINAIENQILVRNAKGISNEQMEEFKNTFTHFDKDHSGSLDRNEFKACLLATGYQLGENAEECVDKIIAGMTLQEEGRVTLDDFIHFMTSANSNDDTAENLAVNFKVLSHDKDYISPDTLRSELKPTTADYIISKLQPSADPEAPEGSLDFQPFLKTVYNIDV